MTDITSLSIPKELITVAKELNINCSKVSREAISTAIKEAQKKESQPVG
jgi:post-segregation antitoxin (ccd killing protein)